MYREEWVLVVVRRPLFAFLALSIVVACVAAEPPRRPWLDPNTGEPFFPLGWFEWEAASIGGPKGPESLALAIESLDAMAAEGVRFAQVINEFTDQVRNLGPSPLNGERRAG